MSEKEEGKLGRSRSWRSVGRTLSGRWRRRKARHVDDPDADATPDADANGHHVTHPRDDADIWYVAAAACVQTAPCASVSGGL